MRSRFCFKVLAIVFSIEFLLCPMVVRADLSSSMESIFNDMGYAASATAPGAYSGQERNYATMGSLRIRNPYKKVSLMSVQLPDIKAGCGGIDVFLGGFSFINKDQFITMARNIGQSAVGFAFNIALKALTPLVGDEIAALRKTIEFINKMAADSCAAGKFIADNTVGRLATTLSMSASTNNTSTGASTDMIGAIHDCTSSPGGCLDNLKTASDESTSEKFFGNLTWHALQQIEELTDAERQLMMSALGSVIIDKESNSETGTVRYLPAKIDIKTLAFGTGDVDGSGESSYAVYNCGSDSSCLSPSEEEVRSKPFLYQVMGNVDNLYEDIKNKNELSETMKQFIGAVPVSVITQLRGAANPAIQESLRNYLTVGSRSIAVQMAAQWLDEAIIAVRTGLGAKKLAVPADFQKAILDRKAEMAQMIAEEGQKLQVEMAMLGLHSTIYTNLYSDFPQVTKQ